MALEPRHSPRPTFESSDAELNDGFEWAVGRALAWVQTGRPGAIPSYWAGLTDRPMFYSRDLAHQALGAHLLGLDTENFTMLDTFVRSANEARAHYPLWAFMFDGNPAAIDYRSDEEFVREVPAVFELVEASLTQHLWTGDARYISDASFLTYYRNALTKFVELHDPLGDGVGGESGTKEIFRGTPSYNESPRGGGMHVAADGISSQIAALRAVGRHYPDAAFASWARAEAIRLRDRFEEIWWEHDSQHYVSGFFDDQPITDFAFEPSWFPATKSIMSGSRATAHLDFLSAALVETPPQNIEAFTYLPEAFLAYGQDERALEWIRFLLRSRAAYPEVSFTAVAHLLVGLTGLRPLDGETVETRNHLPGGRVDVRSVPLGSRLLDLTHVGSEASVLAIRGDGAPLTWIAWNGDRRTETLVLPGQRVSVDRHGTIDHKAKGKQ